MRFDWVEKFDLLLLDFDGLLVNTEALHYKAYQLMVQSLGFDFPIDYSTYLSGAHISQEALKNLIYSHCTGLKEKHPDWQAIRAIKQKLYLEEIENGHIELMAGVGNLIDSIQYFQKKACIVTNSPFEQIQLVCSRLPKLKEIPHLITREDYAKAKPEPDGYLKAIEKFGKPADRIIGFEDSEKGIESLLKANIFAVKIDPHLQETKANLLFQDFHQVNFAST